MTYFLTPPPPNPPTLPKTPTKETAFTVHSTDGTADVFVSGLLSTATDDQFRIATSWMSANGVDRTLSKISQSGGLSPTKFSVTGLNDDDRVALFENKNFLRAQVSGGPVDPRWVKASKDQLVKVSADQFTQMARSGKMEKYAKCRFIEFYPFGSMERTPAVSERDWTSSVKAALDEIWNDRLGQSMIKLLSKPVVIRPWIPSALGALSDILHGTWYIDFSPQSCNDKQVASSPAEVLFHEIIHVIENKKDGYKDLAGFVFDGSEFMSINVTNIFSSNQKRDLRKDHLRGSPDAPPNKMPQNYVSNPMQHALDLKDDYKIAKTKHPHIFKAAADASSSWNPYAAYNTL